MGGVAHLSLDDGFPVAVAMGASNFGLAFCNRGGVSCAILLGWLIGVIWGPRKGS